MARIAVVGAGVVGVATAYLLCKAGHSVTLVDRNPKPGQGVSRRNGAQLSYAYGDALASPWLLAFIPEILAGRDPAYRFRLQADPEFLIWGLRFLSNCLAPRFEANTRYLLEMAEQTRTILQELLNEFTLSFDYEIAGKMLLYPSEASFVKGDKVRAIKHAMGLRLEALDRAAATRIEPALDTYRDHIGRVVYCPDDAVGRPDRFCEGLVEGLVQRYGLRRHFGREARKIQSRAGAVTGLTFRAGDPIDCDAVVVATGNETGLLPFMDRPRGGLWPIQGYSFTAQATERSMRVSITDVKRKLVFARIGEEVRVAGLADIGPRRVAFDSQRFDALKSSASEAFVEAFQPITDGNPWTEGRPCTPSSRPVVRPGSLSGLYLNLGHGGLGWTLCLGSSAILLRYFS
jgi:D-amino-acid dehydrogenase